MLTRLVNIPEQLDFFLFGPRSTGKSTLLGQAFSREDTATFDLLNQATLEQFHDSPDAFRNVLAALSPKVTTVVVDEVQRLPQLLDTVQEFIGRKRFRFALTGSSARKLRRGHANMLGGRAVTRSLWPLTSFEIEDSPEILERKMNWGGLPQVFLAGSDEERKDLLRTYVQTYLSEEVVAEQLVRNLLPFRKFLVVAAQMNGKIINTNSIGRDLGVSHNTVRSYFEILEDTLVGFSLPAYESSVRKRVRGKSKFYLFDTGVYRALSRTLEYQSQPGTSAYGDLFEQMVVCEFKALCAYLKPDWELFFVQTMSSSEVDLVIDTGMGGVIAVEIKSTRDVSKINLAAEISLMEDLNGSRSYILSQDPLAKAITPTVTAMHWRDGLAEIFAIERGVLLSNGT